MTTHVFADGHSITLPDPDRRAWAELPPLVGTFNRLVAQHDADGTAGAWISLEQLTEALRYLEDTPGLGVQTVDARCRALRTPKHGGHIVEAANGMRRVIPADSPRWHAEKDAEAANTKPDVELAADELSTWLNKWRHVLKDSHAKRLKSMAGLILRDAGHTKVMPGQLSLTDEVEL